MPLRKSIAIPNDTSHLVGVRDMAAEVAGAAGFDQADVMKIVLAVDEAVANVIEHAYADVVRGQARLEIEMASDRTMFEVTIFDHGKTFDPDAVGPLDIAENIKRKKKGGLGLFLIRKIMNEIRYEFGAARGNKLQMRKYVDGAKIE